MKKGEIQATFFRNISALRSWLIKYHETESELWLGYYKKSSKKFNYSWSESVDQFICFGWIDGIRKSIDNERYTIRITPRNPKSNWSAINLKKAEKLLREKSMYPKGIQAYKIRKIDLERQYSFEQKTIEFPEQFLKLFKRNKVAWNYFKSCSPSVQKQSAWFVLSAKMDETRLRRLNLLITCSAKKEKLPQLN